MTTRSQAWRFRLPRVSAMLAFLLIVGGGVAAASLGLPTLLFFLSYSIVGAILIIRRPRNPIGWLLVLNAIAWLHPGVANVDLAALQSGTASTGDFLIAWLDSWTGTASYALFIALTLVFPAGQLPVGRWRTPAIGAELISLATIVLTMFAPAIVFNVTGGTTNVSIPNRLGLLGWLPIWSVVTTDVLILPSIVLLAVVVVAQIVRYRRAGGLLRLQLRWLVAALSLVVVAVLMGLMLLLVFGDAVGAAAWIPAVLAFPTVPIAIGFAVLRYRLMEIDRVMSRTIGWVLVTATLVAGFGAAVLVLQALLAGVTQGQTLAVAVSTLIAFALFQPLRRRIQAAVDRRFDRARSDAQLISVRFAERVRNEVDLVTLRVALLRTADQAVRPYAAGLWLRHEGERG